MNDYLKHYKLTLTAQAPVFIGNGKSVSKKEYIFSKVEKKIYVPNQIKMFQFMVETHRTNEFQLYLLKSSDDFVNWLYKMNITKAQYMQWVDYTVDSGDAIFEEKSKKEIATFVKDPYGNPYIPGSSLKGALRTVLLGSKILQNQATYSYTANDVIRAEFNGRKSYLASEAGKCEAKAFYTVPRQDVNGQDIVNKITNDAMAGFIVSDSKPLPKDSLVLCQKTDEKVDGTANRLNIMRECLKPGTVMEFTLTIDTSLIKLTPQQLMQAVNSFVQSYETCFSSHFKQEAPLPQNSILIGGGVGYASKTVTYQLLGKNSTKYVAKIIDNTLSAKTRSEHQHAKDERLGVSPHMIKRAYYNLKKFDMGVCNIKIE